jgi:hypothetical protein
MRVTAAVLLGLVLAGCASTFDFRRQELFESSAKRYGNLIRWSEFEPARAFLATEGPAVAPAVPSRVRVAGYELVQMAFTADVRQVAQVVEITYFKVDDPRTRTLTDRQLWEFDPVKEAWFLKSGFPDFK